MSTLGAIAQIITILIQNSFKVIFWRVGFHPDRISGHFLRVGFKPVQ